jgi:hypothetical protein
MSLTKTAGTGTDFRTLRTGQFPRIAGMPVNGGDSPAFATAGPGAADQLGRQFRMTGIELSADELDELNIFKEFLEGHVQSSMTWDVQCMLLWNEWVRTFRRQKSGFPGLIREQEFRTAITGRFGVGITTDGWRGLVYSGLRFVP